MSRFESEYGIYQDKKRRGRGETYGGGALRKYCMIHNWFNINLELDQFYVVALS